MSHEEKKANLAVAITITTHLVKAMDAMTDADFQCFEREPFTRYRDQVTEIKKRIASLCMDLTQEQINSVLE